MRGVVFLVSVIFLWTTIPFALAQKIELAPPVVAVIDVKTVEEESEVWKDLRKQMDGLRAKYREAVEAEQEEFKKENTKLQQEQSLISEEVYKQRESKLKEEFQKLQQGFQVRQKILASQLQMARVQVRQALSDVISEIAEENDINIIFNQSAATGSLLFTRSDLSITKAALEALNKKIKTLTLPPPPDIDKILSENNNQSQ